MIRKFQTFIVLIVLVSILITGAFGVYFLSEYSESINRQTLVSVGRFFERETAAGVSYAEAGAACIQIFSRESGDVRITVIEPSGKVLYDSAEDAEKMDNHLDRSEVISAFESQDVAYEKRYSRTLSVDMLYMADYDPLFDTVVRVSTPLVEYREGVLRMQFAFLAVIIVAILVLSAFSFFYSKRLTKPLRELKTAAESLSASDYSARISSGGTDEIGSLSAAFNEMADRLEQEMKELEDKNKKLAELQDMKAEFAANVSHELKTPLTSIRGFIDTLRNADQMDTQTRRRFLEIIDIEAQRLHQLINDVLQLSDIERLEQEYEAERFDINQVIEEVVSMLEEKASERGIEIIRSEIEPLPVLASKARMKQILINLLDNAIKYNRENGKVWIQVIREPDRMISISVRDTGEGIEAEHLPRIFERFYHVDKSRSRELGGTGLGLSIVKHISRLYEGSATAESEVGKGSVFTVRIRVADDLV
jgi:two-component system phosphate regulon sensor histidine kinase PhoR